MKDALLKLPEAEIKRWADRVALICLSEDFQELNRELEQLYKQSGIDQASVVAFSDALYTFLAEKAALDEK